MVCIDSGKWIGPTPTPRCITDKGAMKEIDTCMKSKYVPTITEVDCGAPPEKPTRGTIQWRGKSHYGSEAKYRCRPYAKFRNATSGNSYDEATVRCQWNRTWSSIEDDCIGEIYNLRPILCLKHTWT